ncbi:two-component system, repressor protein LuxO [Devosia sp. YR412]|uniref:sigma-54-dependent transcriptional regulator n=1 Tax=Devosia sp. YR412 TaxID=1881030 RepID=UPI0008CD108B|nr:sigma-54 dependent transcriptional regulator [Devosia sp. YR412]SEP85886.1 two-component system, repressor protein LuxO [Devosia sp. YR412]
MAMHNRSNGEPFGRLLLVDADDASAQLVSETLGQSLGGSLRITVVSGGRPAAELLRDGGYDIILADLQSLRDLSDRSDDAVARLVRLADGALVVALSDGASVSAAVGAMRAGAHDYVTKPLSGPAMAARISELAQRHGKARALSIEPQSEGLSDFAGFIGSSSAMQFVYEQIGRISTSSAPVFITGESGTGKDVCAEALHAKGPRMGKRLVAINCAAIPRDLMESELFGVARGAFTGAHEDRKGAAELADGGTLFLDEIGEMDLSLQSKLLRFLQTGTLSRVGEAGVRQVDVRVICATNRNPMQLISEKKFREDLFYRLHVLPIHLPPLRQRPSDIMVLARHFLARYSAEERKSFTGFAPDVAALLTSAEWPGNVRQLQNLVRRLVVMCDGAEITMPMLRAADIESQGLAPAPEPMPRGERRQAILPMWQQEQRIIEDAIASFGGNVSLAAAALEISPSTIYRKRQGWSEMAVAS